MTSSSLVQGISHYTLDTSARIPPIGLGTFGSDSVTAPKIAQAVIQAAELGYRHFDCASVYGNEREIGEALACFIASGIPRKELWITSKVWNNCHAPADLEKSCLQSIADLGVALPGESWPANQFYDIWPWHGTSSYVAGTWLATLTAGVALAKAAGDSSFAAECAARLSKAQSAFESNLWNGSYYRLWNDRLTDKVSDVCLANQLMSVWCTRVVGLDDALPAAHIHTALDTIERLNMNATAYGMINAVTPDGKRYAAGGSHAQHIFFGEILCGAMTFLYHGRRDTGLEIARRLYSAVAVKNASPGNQRCLIDGETGMPLWGTDYYSDLAIWAFPMALSGESVAQFARNGLVKSMISAAKTAS